MSPQQKIFNEAAAARVEVGTLEKRLAATEAEMDLLKEELAAETAGRGRDQMGLSTLIDRADANALARANSRHRLTQEIQDKDNELAALKELMAVEQEEREEEDEEREERRRGEARERRDTRAKSDKLRQKAPQLRWKLASGRVQHEVALAKLADEKSARQKDKRLHSQVAASSGAALEREKLLREEAERAHEEAERAHEEDTGHAQLGTEFALEVGGLFAEQKLTAERLERHQSGVRKTEAMRKLEAELAAKDQRLAELDKQVAELEADLQQAYDDDHPDEFAEDELADLRSELARTRLVRQGQIDIAFREGGILLRFAQEERDKIQEESRRALAAAQAEVEKLQKLAAKRLKDVASSKLKRQLSRSRHQVEITDAQGKLQAAQEDTENTQLGANFALDLAEQKLRDVQLEKQQEMQEQAAAAAAELQGVWGGFNVATKQVDRYKGKMKEMEKVNAAAQAYAMKRQASSASKAEAIKVLEEEAAEVEAERERENAALKQGHAAALHVAAGSEAAAHAKINQERLERQQSSSSKAKAIQVLKAKLAAAQADTLDRTSSSAVKAEAIKVLEAKLAAAQAKAQSEHDLFARHHLEFAAKAQSEADAAVLRRNESREQRSGVHRQELEEARLAFEGQLTEAERKAQSEADAAVLRRNESREQRSGVHRQELEEARLAFEGQLTEAERKAAQDRSKVMGKVRRLDALHERKAHIQGEQLAEAAQQAAQARANAAARRAKVIQSQQHIGKRTNRRRGGGRTIKKRNRKSKRRSKPKSKRRSKSKTRRRR